MADHLIDTNVFSKFFLGDINVRKFLGNVDACINTVVYIELIQGSIKKQHKELIKKHIAVYPCFQITPQISLKTIEIINKYSASNGLFLADALIAATAIEHDLVLVTFNTRDFEFIKGLRVIRP